MVFKRESGKWTTPQTLEAPPGLTCGCLRQSSVVSAVGGPDHKADHTTTPRLTCGCLRRSSVVSRKAAKPHRGGASSVRRPDHSSPHVRMRALGRARIHLRLPTAILGGLGGERPGPQSGSHYGASADLRLPSAIFGRLAEIG